MTDPTTIRYQPDDYVCPFCGLLAGRFDELNDPDDIVARQSLAYARVSPMCWVDHPGNALVVPTDHVENLYRFTLAQTTAVFDLVRRVAIAMRASYGCDGVSIRQHNEPAGDQDVWHMHVHVLPRYAGDDLYLNHRQTRRVWLDERRPYAQRLRSALGS